jgi:hypothetical protein
MATANTLLFNYAILWVTVLLGLIAASCRWPYWGVLVMLPLAGGMMALGYLVSYYLNACADSSHRATVLSFKGVAFNLGYGFISLLFALVLRAGRDGRSPSEAVAHAFTFLPWWLILGGILCTLSFAKHRRLLNSVIKPNASGS